VSAVIGMIAFVVVASVAGAIWRTRPQFVNPRTEARFVLFVLMLAVVGVTTSGPSLGKYVIAGAPIALFIGWQLGRALEGTLRFWTDPGTGRLKFRGGAAYFVILAASALGRIFLRYVLTGSLASHADPVDAISQALMVVVGMLLFMDTGLYFARAQAIAAAAGERVDWRWFSVVPGRA
jgi:hypothetical protein